MPRRLCPGDCAIRYRSSTSYHTRPASRGSQRSANRVTFTSFSTTLSTCSFNEATSLFPEAWWFMLFPGIALLLTVLAFNLVGDGLQDALDPRRR